MSPVILQTAGRTLFHTLVLFSLWIFFAGHNNPGGGFIGGLVAGAALVLRYLAEGPDDLRLLVPARPPTLLGAGLACAAVSAMLGPLTGHGVMAGVHADLHVPALGVVKLSSVLLFDAGVYLIVIGMVYGILETLGGDVDA